MGAKQSAPHKPPPYRPYLIEPGSDTIAPIFDPKTQEVNDIVQESEAKADSRSSPPLDDAQNFMYRSTILV